MTVVHESLRLRVAGLAGNQSSMGGTPGEEATDSVSPRLGVLEERRADPIVHFQRREPPNRAEEGSR